MLSFRPKGGISDSANDRDVSTSLRFARHDRTTFILSTYLVTIMGQHPLPNRPFYRPEAVQHGLCRMLLVQSTWANWACS